jgi:flavin reductase (DIM6/NTAB) family NADH-FMN oxidoreductase RutF
MSHDAADASALRAVAGHFATGVCVVTTQTPEGPHGMTLNSFTTVTLEPPTVAIFLNRASTTAGLVASSGRYCVNVLGVDSEATATRFAGRSETKFAGIGWHEGRAGGVVLEGALAVLECVVSERIEIGTHTMFLGRVESTGIGQGDPLLFYRGQMIDTFTAARLAG